MPFHVLMSCDGAAHELDTHRENAQTCLRDACWWIFESMGCSDKPKCWIFLPSFIHMVKQSYDWWKSRTICSPLLVLPTLLKMMITSASIIWLFSHYWFTTVGWHQHVNHPQNNTRSLSANCCETQFLHWTADQCYTAMVLRIGCPRSIYEEMDRY